MTPTHGARIDLEIAVTSAAGAAVARDNGADRVELCSALELGGLTPSRGLIDAVLTQGLPVHVLVRCRPGDFVYDVDEVTTMLRDVRALAGTGVSGIVFGALDAHGSLDLRTLELLADAAGSAGNSSARLDLTVHRAVDHAADPMAAVAALAELGADRVLTSGAAARVRDGLDTLAAMVRQAGSVQVMAGGGLAIDDIARVAAIGARAVHLSASVSAPGRPRPSWVPLGAAGTTADSDVHRLTDPALVRAARQALDAAAPHAD